MVGQRFKFLWMNFKVTKLKWQSVFFCFWKLPLGWLYCFLYKSEISRLFCLFNLSYYFYKTPKLLILCLFNPTVKGAKKVGPPQKNSLDWLLHETSHMFCSKRLLQVVKWTKGAHGILSQFNYSSVCVFWKLSIPKYPVFCHLIGSRTQITTKTRPKVY